MNSYRSYKLKLPMSGASTPDSDARSNSSVGSDNDNFDYAECLRNRLDCIAKDLRQQSIQTSFDPLHRNSALFRASSFLPMPTFQATETSPVDEFGRRRYGFNYGTDRLFMSIPPRSMAPSPIFDHMSSLINLDYIRKRSNVNGQAAKGEWSRPLVNINGMSFAGKDEPKKSDPERKKDNAKKCKPKSARKKADSRFHHLGCPKTRGCFRCKFCERKFSYICHMKVHERVHTGEKPYSCKYCNHQFSQLGSLTVHMRIHTGAKPYRCGECWKKFRHVNSLRRHQRQVHSMTSEQISRSIDKVKDATLLENQLGTMNQAVRSPPPAVPYDFRASLPFGGLPMQWYGANGLWNHTYQNMFVFGQKNQLSKNNQMIPTLVTPIETSKLPPNTWRPFEESTESIPNGESNDVRVNRHATDERVGTPHEGKTKDFAKSPAAKSNTETRETMSDGYASMDEE